MRDDVIDYFTKSINKENINRPLLMADAVLDDGNGNNNTGIWLVEHSGVKYVVKRGPEVFKEKENAEIFFSKLKKYFPEFSLFEPIAVVHNYYMITRQATLLQSKFNVLQRQARKDARGHIEDKLETYDASLPVGIFKQQAFKEWFGDWNEKSNYTVYLVGRIKYCFTLVFVLCSLMYCEGIYCSDLKLSNMAILDQDTISENLLKGAAFIIDHDFYKYGDEAKRAYLSENFSKVFSGNFSVKQNRKSPNIDLRWDPLDLVRVRGGWAQDPIGDLPVIMSTTEGIQPIEEQDTTEHTILKKYERCKHILDDKFQIKALLELIEEKKNSP